MAWLAALLLAPWALTQDLKALKNVEEVVIRAESGEYDLKGDEIHLRPGRNRISYGPVEMAAREMWFNQRTRDVRAEGDVVIRLEDGTSWASQRLSGNLDSLALEFGAFGFDGDVWHSGGASGRNTADGEKTLTDAWLSTCDHYPPHYRLSASTIRHHPDNTFSASNVVLKLGGVPVFYLPYAWGTTDNTQGLIVKPGYSGKRGAYLQLGRIWKLGDDNFTRTYVDMMTKRGIGLGHDTEIVRGAHTNQLTLYGLLDSDPPETDSDEGWNRRFREEHDRYRLRWYYRYDHSRQTALRLNLDLLSDIDMLEDWFRRDHRTIRQPKSYLDLTTHGDWYDASVTVRPRLNDFYTVVETLPELRLDIPRLTLGQTPFAYQSETTMGYYSMKWRDFERSRLSILGEELTGDDVAFRRDPGDYRAFRADTAHSLYLPLSWRDIVTFTPRAGGRLTYYSASSRRRVTQTDLADMLLVDDSDVTYRPGRVERYDRDGGEVFRAAWELGAELRTRLYSDWAQLELKPIGGNGLRHIVEPYVNYTFAPDPSHDRDHLYFFDETDRLERQHFVRFGLDQLWQTRLDGEVRTLARWQNYLDLHFDRGDESGSHGGDLGSRLDLFPSERFSTWTTLLHDLGEGDIQRGEFGLRYGLEDEFRMSLRYVYRNDHLSRSVYSMGSTLVDLTGESSYLKKYYETADTLQLDMFIPIDSKTSFEVSAEYDFEESTLSEHRYLLNRQLHCWIMTLGAGWDNGDFEAVVMFRLTAFPKVKIDLNL